MKPKSLKIGEILYWNDGSDLGECNECDEKAFSYNEDGHLLCEDCLIEWHESPMVKICLYCEEVLFDCDC
jgi:hypothetical protein